MKKIAMSFENANKSVTASEISKKAAFDKQETGSSPLKIMHEESSSSGDFNIWGDAENSGSAKDSGEEQLESEDSHELLDGKKSGRKSKQSYESPDSAEFDQTNFNNFNSFFNKVRGSQKQKASGLKI